MPMPGCDGVEAIIAIRREFPRTNITAMSGGGQHVGTEALRYVRGRGAHTVLEKPFALELLREAVRTLLASP